MTFSKGEKMAAAVLQPASVGFAGSAAYFRNGSVPAIALGIALTFGPILVFLTAPFQSPGEFQHFYRAYQISEGQWAASYRGDVGGGALPKSLPMIVQPFYNLRFHPEKKTSSSQIRGALKIPLNAADRQFTPFITALYSPVGYVPQSVAIALGRWMGLSPLRLMYLGRLSNLLCWTLIVYAALKITPIYRRALLLLMFMPMSIFTAASLSIDALTNSCALLVAAIVLRYSIGTEESDAQQPMPTSMLLTLALATVITTTAKLAYLPLAGLVLLIPSQRLGGRRRYAAIVAGLLAVNIAAVAAWAPYTHPLTVQVHDDATVSARGQAAYLLAHPAAFATVPMLTVLDNGWFLIRSFVGRLGWTDTRLAPAFLLVYLSALIAASIPENRQRMPVRFGRAVAVSSICIAVSVAIVGLLNYLYWTPVGHPSITALQGRYFIPVAPAAIILVGSLWGRVLPPRSWPRNLMGADAMAAMIAIIGCTYTLIAVYRRYYG
jgi:uncharacterized membrane protein